MIRKIILLFLSLLMLAVLMGGFAVNELRTRWEQPLAIPEEGYLLTIKQGDSLRMVVTSLNDAGVLPHPDLVVLYGRYTGQDQLIKRGEYLLQPGLTSPALLDLLQSGAVVSYRVTLPEGITLKAAIETLAQQPQLEIVLEGAKDPRILELIEPHTVPEGLFFPDSYQYVRGDTDWSILSRAHEALDEILMHEWQDRAEDLPYETPYEALIMASIIERETGVAGERGQISGVFFRRLKKGMLLQTDPTVIYGLGESFDGNLRRAHLSEEDNVYNTYRHPGLPPSPIALPGRAAIHAALHPEPGTTLYFVARGDGGHVFSDTLKAHNRAVRDYQLRRRQDYRSSPGESQ